MTTVARSRFSSILDAFTAFVTSMGAIVAALAMTVLFGVGLWEVCRGAWTAVAAAHGGGTTLPPAGAHGGRTEAVTLVIQGVELVLLAPVAYLTFVALNKYLQRPTDEAYERGAHRELLSAKSFIAGLLFAMVATDAVGKALEAEVTLNAVVPRTLLMVAIGAYFFVLESLVAKHRHSEADE